MSNATLPAFWQKFTGPDGKPLSGGKLYFFVGGSTTIPKAVYSDHENANPITQPVVLDASGLAPQYFAESGLYCIVLKDAVGALVATRDYVESPSSSGSATGDHKFALADDDAEPGYALEKIKEGEGIQVTGVLASPKYLRITSKGMAKVSAGGNLRYLGTVFVDSESMSWTVDADSITAHVDAAFVEGLNDHLVLASDVDNTPGTLIDKMVSLTLLITSESSGADQQIHIETLCPPGQVSIDQEDAEAGDFGHLATKLRAGAGITLTTTTDATDGKILWINSKANSWLPVSNTNVSAYTVKDADAVVNCNGPSTTVTLPNPGATYEGRIVHVVACGIGVSVTLACPGGSSFLVGASTSFSNYAAREAICLAGASGWVWVLRA